MALGTVSLAASILNPLFLLTAALAYYYAYRIYTTL